MGSAQLLLGARRVRERDLLPSYCHVVFIVAFSGIFNLEVGTCKPLNLSQKYGRANRFLGMEKVRTFLSRTKTST